MIPSSRKPRIRSQRPLKPCGLPIQGNLYYAKSDFIIQIKYNF